MNRNHTGIVAFVKAIGLMLYVVVYAWGVYLIFGAMWALMLFVLYWLILNPIALVALAVLYLVLFAPNFYPVMTGESLWRRSRQAAEQRRRA
jgi:hypothetical protein